MIKFCLICLEYKTKQQLLILNKQINLLFKMNTEIKRKQAQIKHEGFLQICMYDCKSLREIDLKPDDTITCLQFVKDLKYFCSPYPFEWSLDGIEIFPNVRYIEIIGGDGLRNVVKTLEANNIKQLCHITLKDYGMRDKKYNEELWEWRSKHVSILDSHEPLMLYTAQKIDLMGENTWWLRG